MGIQRDRSGTGDSFADVINRARDGDDDAIAMLYTNHVGIVHGYLRACGVRDPDDLTSEVFVGMLRNLRQFDGQQSDFRRWLMTIAYRRVLDDRRRRGRNKIDLESPQTLAHANDATGTTDLRPAVVDPSLAAAFRELTHAQREVLALRFVADLSLQDVAEVSGRPVSAVKSLQNRGLNALRRIVPDVLRQKEA